jgi:hypothetical protein
MLAPFYHVGIIVPELGEAMRDLTSTLGLNWASEQRAEMPILLNGIQTTRDIQFVYSTDGPPYVELIGANEPPWELQDGLQHMGIWCEDVVADMEKLVNEDGYTVAATGVTRKGGPGGFAYLNSPTGLLVELVDQRGKAALEGWIAGGDYM